SQTGTFLSVTPAYARWAWWLHGQSARSGAAGRVVAAAAEGDGAVRDAGLALLPSRRRGRPCCVGSLVPRRQASATPAALTAAVAIAPTVVMAALEAPASPRTVAATTAGSATAA